MRYSLLNFVECPVSHTELVCLTTKEAPLVLPHVRHYSTAKRVNQPGAVVGPIPAFREPSELTEALQQEACEPADPSRNYEAMVEEGLLVSGETGRWYPIRNFIPELLPDHLRDFGRDVAFLDSIRHRLPGSILDRLKRYDQVAQDADAGAHHKLAEIRVPEKVSDPNFFGPGYISPFNPGTPDHSVFLVKSFAFCLPMIMGDGTRRVVLDAGCGYAWTTYWLMMGGFEPIGIDISRIYLDIAVARFRESVPYVLVADTENLPLRSAAFDVVLGFDAFHHLPDRNRAMHQFDRVMKEGAEIVLMEPGREHEHSHHSREVMALYGTLEKGMDLEDVVDYVKGTGLLKPEQHYILKLERNKAEALLVDKEIRENLYMDVDSRLISIRKARTSN